MPTDTTMHVRFKTLRVNTVFTCYRVKYRVIDKRFCNRCDVEMYDGVNYYYRAENIKTKQLVYIDDEDTVVLESDTG